jgi:peptidoglycan hydrolase CwlO-like protein
MDKAALEAWKALHLRVAKGEALSPEEQARYDAGARELDAEEKLDGGLEELRRTRKRLKELTAELERLQGRRKELDEQIAALEAALDERTRQLLQVED